MAKVECQSVRRSFRSHPYVETVRQQEEMARSYVDDVWPKVEAGRQHVTNAERRNCAATRRRERPYVKAAWKHVDDVRP